MKYYVSKQTNNNNYCAKVLKIDYNQADSEKLSNTGERKIITVAFVPTKMSGGYLSKIGPKLLVLPFTFHWEFSANG